MPYRKIKYGNRIKDSKNLTQELDEVKVSRPESVDEVGDKSSTLV